MGKFHRCVLFYSLVAGFLSCNLYIFTWDSVYYQFTAIQKFMVALVVVHLTRQSLWGNRGAWINLLISGIDLLKEFRKELMIDFFDPTRIELGEYLAVTGIVISCLIGYRGLFKIILLLKLNLTTPEKPLTKCLKKMNSIDIVYPRRAGLRYSNGDWEE